MVMLSATLVAPRMIDGVAAARALFAGIAAATDEVAAIAYLAGDRRLLGMRHIRGSRDWVAVSPRTLATDALALDARGIIMAHNHPSGDATPSARDLAQMRCLARALEALDIRLIDSLVLAGDETTSLRSLGLL